MPGEPKKSNARERDCLRPHGPGSLAGSAPRTRIEAREIGLVRAVLGTSNRIHDGYTLRLSSVAITDTLRPMAARSHDSHPRGTMIRDRAGDTWRKGTAWWHWTGRGADTGPGKLLWSDLEHRYGPLVVLTTTVPPVAPRPRGGVPPEHARRIYAALAARDRAESDLRQAVLEASEDGASVRELATLLDVSTNTVQRWKREAGKIGGA